MRKIILKCRPYSRFHLGNFTENQSNALMDAANFIHSDVIYAALFDLLGRKGEEEVKRYQALFEKGEIRFSSAFPCLLPKTEGKTPIFLYPKPMCLNVPNPKNPLPAIYAKTLKKLSLISERVWQEGILPHEWAFENENDKKANVMGNWVVHQEEMSPNQAFSLSKKVENPKVQVRTTEEEGNFYYQTDLMLMQSEDYEVHWFFEEESNVDATQEEEWISLLEELALSGIGGERSTGAGAITSVEVKAKEKNKWTDSGFSASLSLSIPKSTEISGWEAYQTIKRGGRFLGKEERLKTVNMVQEGGVFRESVEGKMVILGNKNIRCGYTFSKPLPPTYADLLKSFIEQTAVIS